MNTAQILQHSDLCPRRAYYSLRWRPPSLSPRHILIEAIEHGLMAEGDAGDAAEVRAMDLAVDPGLDTAEPDLLSLAQHIAGLANITAWVVRGTSGPWQRPDPVGLADGSPWASGAFLSHSERSLRRVCLVDRWDAWTQMAVERSWDVLGECSTYGAGMGLLVVEIGKLRKGRWATPFTVGYRHPVQKSLRFRQRDGDDFGSTWQRVSRETDAATREEWLDAMVDDGVLAEMVHVHQVPVPDRAAELCNIALRRMARIREVKEPPEESLTACFSRIHPCPFRSCCPRGLEPSPELGFVPLTSLQ
jgi:hypothetical protein